MHYCSTFDFHGHKVCHYEHFSIAKICNFSTNCSYDDDGNLYCTKTEGEISKEVSAIYKNMEVFGNICSYDLFQLVIFESR
jgi:hypothetical protein